MKCNNCGHMLPSDSEFCQHCGAKISSMTASINRNPVKPSAQRPSNVRENVLSEKKLALNLVRCSFPCLIITVILLTICLNLKSIFSRTEIFYLIPIALSIIICVLTVVNYKRLTDSPILTDIACFLSVGALIPFFFKNIWNDGNFLKSIKVMLVVAVILFALNIIAHCCYTVIANLRLYHRSAKYKIRCYEKLDKMNTLKEKSIISKEEYDRLKQQIIEKIL